MPDGVILKSGRKEVYMERLKFEEMELSNEMKKAVAKIGFIETTPIQSMVIPKMFEGKDIIGQAQTGTGKTLAYAMPAVESLKDDEKSLQVLVLCPTRELTLQVAEEFEKLLRYKKNSKVLAIYGGEQIYRQIKTLKEGVQIVVGTPGRIMDHMRRKTLRLDNLRMVIIDEADEMLNMGFISDIEIILGAAPKKRQTAMFSATMPAPILELTRKFLKDPEYMKTQSKELTVDNVEQMYFNVRTKDKIALLSRLIKMYTPKRSIVFCNMKSSVDELTNALKAKGYSADAIHGNLRQAQRNRVMEDFRDGKIEILVATDVAARGLDIDNIEIVFNYDIPQYDEFYIHRIGRTARMGKDGLAITFVSGRDMYKLREIEKYAKTVIKRAEIPSANEAEHSGTEKIIEKIKFHLKDEDLKKYVKIVDEMIENNYSAVDIAASLFKISMELSGIGSHQAHEDEIEIIKDMSFERSDNKNKKKPQGRYNSRTKKVWSH